MREGDIVASQGIVVVRNQPLQATRQGLPQLEGVSDRTAGSKQLSLHLVVIPPGGAAEPHMHDGFETAIYMLSGVVRTRFGRGLTESVVTGEGDFLFIPPGLPHQPINLSATEAARALVARSTGDDQERVLPYVVS